MDRFHFFFKRSFRYKNDDEKTKNETIVFKTLVFYENVLKKRSFSKTTVFKKLVVTLTIVNDDPSLKIVNEERRREETDLKGIGTYH